MQRFNKNKAIKKLSNRNNDKTKLISISVSIVILIVAIIYFSFARFEAINTYSLISGTANIPPRYFNQYLRNLNTNDVVQNDLTIDQNMRYVGANPNNYVLFNCEDEDNPTKETCELWRVIGVFNSNSHGIENTDLVKIVKAEAEEDDISSQFRWNWATSDDANMINRPTYSNIKNSKFIEEALWKTNGVPGTTTSAVNFYTEEHGTSMQDTPDYNITWTGKLTLPYESDFLLATNGGNTANRTSCVTEHNPIGNQNENWKIYESDSYPDSSDDWNIIEENSGECTLNSWMLRIAIKANMDYDIGAFNTMTSNNGTQGTIGVSFGQHKINTSGMFGAANFIRYMNWSNSGNMVPTLYLKSNTLCKNCYSSTAGTVDNPFILTMEDNIVKYINNQNTSDLAYDQTTDNNLRYVGSKPSNYMYFNCSTTDPSLMDDTTCEKWRIVGVMNNIEDDLGNKESRVKIIRDESLGDYVWNSSSPSVNSGCGENQWGPSGSFTGAHLMRELNTDYLGNITVGTNGKWYNGGNNQKTANMPTSSINTDAQSMIQKVKWNLGSPNNDNGTYVLYSSSDLTAPYVYEHERANTNGKICSSGEYCNDTVVRTSDWIGNIGLIYPSDYLYATTGGTTTNRETCLNTGQYSWSQDSASDCKNNDWLYTGIKYWTLSPLIHKDYARGVFYMDVNGEVYGGHGASLNGVRPSLYLKNNISIISGSGTSTDPYKIRINN